MGIKWPGAADEVVTITFQEWEQVEARCPHCLEAAEVGASGTVSSLTGEMLVYCHNCQKWYCVVGEATADQMQQTGQKKRYLDDLGCPTLALQTHPFQKAE
jgi:hypothetical protein